MKEEQRLELAYKKRGINQKVIRAEYKRVADKLCEIYNARKKEVVFYETIL